MFWNNHYQIRQENPKFIEISKAIATNNFCELQSLINQDSKLVLVGANLSLPNESDEIQYPVLNSTTYRNVDSFVLPRHNLAGMHIAAFADALECFVTLEKNKQSIKTQSADGLLPIHYAIGGGALEVVSYILSKDQTYYENLNAPNVSFIF